MADNLTTQPTIPSRLREDNSALKATPRRGLAEVRLDRSVGQSTADKKTSRPFGGGRAPQTPSGLRLAHSAQRKTSRASHTLDIFEDPQQEARVSELVEKSSIESIAEEDEMETCDRDAKKDEPSLFEEIRDMEIFSLPLITIKEDSKMMLNYDKDSLSTFSRDEVDSVEKDDEYETEERRGDGETEERDEDAVRQYFVAPYGVGDAAKFEEQWSSLKVKVHESDTEIEKVAWGGEEREVCSILNRTLDSLELDEPVQRNYMDEDEDAKTMIFGEEEEFSIDLGYIDWSDEEEMDEDEDKEDEVGDRIRQYFPSRYGVGDADKFAEQYSSLEIEAHDSDTEIEYCTATNHRDTTFDSDDDFDLI